jgi:hypothetical protein
MRRINTMGTYATGCVLDITNIMGDRRGPLSLIPQRSQEGQHGEQPAPTAQGDDPQPKRGEKRARRSIL